MKTIYDCPPVYDTERFTLRLVEDGDAEDLLDCYSDPQAVRLMNSDNCSSGFYFITPSQVRCIIGYWLADYAKHVYIRFAIIEKASGRAVGTVEAFEKDDYPKAQTGLYRLDIVSRLENRDALTELMICVHDHLYDALNVTQLVTKIHSEDSERLSAAGALGYAPQAEIPHFPFGDYYVREKEPLTARMVADSLSCCGLICLFCHESAQCSGCKRGASRCGGNAEGRCPHILCCHEKGIEGCYACPDAPCGKMIFSGGHCVRNRVFPKIAREEGIERLAEYVLRNQRVGILYGCGKDYDSLKTEEEIVDLLHNGWRSPSAPQR